jgi:hypothetical protein
MIGHKFDVRFSITVTSNESTPITKELLQQVSKTLQDALNEPKVIDKIKRRFEWSAVADTRCKVDELFVEPRMKD